DFAAREAAMTALDQLGGTALPALKAALRSSDAEVQWRAEEVAQRIERRLEVQRLLKPRTVRLSYKDTPVAEAVADFAQKTGFQVQILDAERAKITRKITLDTGDVPFWQAYQRLCEAAGLVERPPQP